MVLLDLQKAFDTVNYKIMFQKLEAIGLHKSAKVWFKSYLCERQQSVEINETISKPMTHMWCPTRFNYWTFIISTIY